MAKDKLEDLGVIDTAERLTLLYASFGILDKRNDELVV